MPMLILSQDIEISAGYFRRHLLLGNGFSIAYRPGIFRHDKLFEQADFAARPESARIAFAALHATDFERVNKALRDTAALTAHYDTFPAVVSAMRRDAYVFAGRYGDEQPTEHPRIIVQVNTIKLAYGDKKGLLVDFYDSASAQVWER